MKITNISRAEQGIWTVDGLRFLSPGKSADFEIHPDHVESTKRLAGLLSFGGVDTADEEMAEPGPLDQSIPDLTAHLETMTDADEVQALIDAETAGKSRSGALAALNARRDAILAS